MLTEEKLNKAKPNMANVRPINLERLGTEIKLKVLDQELYALGVPRGTFDKITDAEIEAHLALSEGTLVKDTEKFKEKGNASK